MGWIAGVGAVWPFARGIRQGSKAASRLPGKSSPGFTIIEVIIAMVVATLLGVAVVRFYKDSYKTFSLQEQSAERDQNAHFLVNRFVEVLQQAGSALPDTGWTVIPGSGGVLTIGVNPRGAEHFNGTNTAFSNYIAVANATLFTNTANVLLNTSHVLIDYADPSVATARYAIDAGYNSLGFVKGVKNNSAGMDSLRVTTAVKLSVGDRIYGYREDQYVLVAGNLVIRPNGSTTGQMVLAENIDSVGFTFLDSRGIRTTAWRTMRSAAFTVRARTAKPDPKLPPPGYRKISLPMNVILRNRI